MKKSFLFGLLAIWLAGFWFGGVSLADCTTVTDKTNEHVASITVSETTTYYCTLPAAISAAKDGDIIVMENDYSFPDNSTIIISKNLILDLNGHLIEKTYAHTDYLFDVNAGKTLTVKDSAWEWKISRKHWMTTIRVLWILIVNGGTIESIDNDPYYSITIKCDENGVWKGGTVIINSWTIIWWAWQAVQAWWNVTINGWVINWNVDSWAYKWWNPWNVVINWWTINWAVLSIQWNYSNIWWPEVAATTTINWWNINWILGTQYSVDWNENPLVTQEANPTPEGVTAPILLANWWTFTADPTEYVADWYIAVQKDSKWLVLKKKTVTLDANWWNLAEWTNSTNYVGAWEAFTEPADPTKVWNIFDGWFNWEDLFDFATPITTDTTLTAQWEAMSDPTWWVETPEGETFTWVILEPEETSLTWEDTILVAVASSNTTASMEWVVELNVFKDVDGDGTKDVWTDTLLTSKVNFTAPKVVRIPVNTNSGVIVKVKHNGQTWFTTEWLTKSSTANCTAWVATPAYSGDPITPTSWYVEIYTCSASTFIAYVETPKPVVQWGGWGGSSSYSCKNLPANAVANNTTKPKKNTDYSYSTDTGAVCTFQCKTGYTWNEKDAKCEKATETVADTNDTTVAENTENADTSDSASTEDLQKVLEDGYNVEFHKAYEFAFQNGITTMPTIEEADMNGNLNRIAMVKMLSQYAINILGKTPDTTREVPNFPDVDAQLDADYNNGVTLAYQLGIMWINIDEFRPFDLVTRAEFGTALSRMLFGLADGEGDAYYSTHLEKLMSEWIITNNDPRLEELRGYVMIMLMRSASK